MVEHTKYKMKFFIYQLIHTPTNVCWYAGSTDDMEERWKGHKSKVLSSGKLKLIQRQIKVDKIENIVMKEVDTIEVEGEEKFPWERRYLEQCWINILAPKYNEVRAYIHPCMKKEYKKKHYEENRERIRDNQKKYYDEHKKEAKERSKKYREDNSGEIKLNKKKYYEENKDQILESQKDYQKKYYERDDVKKRRGQTINCCCGCNYTYANQSRHIKTKKHQDWLKNSTAAHLP